jgi:hypothetical protein
METPWGQLKSYLNYCPELIGKSIACQRIKKAKVVLPLVLELALIVPAFAERRPVVTETPVCSSFIEAKKQIGKKQCVSGKVLNVSQSPGGMTFLDFCEDYLACPFTVVVFPEDLHHVGDLKQLVGKTVEVIGKVKDYDGRAEIVLQDSEQLGGEVKKLPRVPKEFDVEQRGKFSPGTFHAPKNRKASHKKAKLPTTIDVEEGGDQ